MIHDSLSLSLFLFALYSYTLTISPLALDDGNFSLSTPVPVRCTRCNIAHKVEKSLFTKFEERFTSTQIDYCAFSRVVRVNKLLLLNYAKNDVSRKLTANPHTDTPSLPPKNPFFSLNVRSFIDAQVLDVIVRSAFVSTTSVTMPDPFAMRVQRLPSVRPNDCNVIFIRFINIHALYSLSFDSFQHFFYSYLRCNIASRCFYFISS